MKKALSDHVICYTIYDEVVPNPTVWNVETARERYLKGILQVMKPIPFLIAVPTTAGTGSETTLATVITDDKKPGWIFPWDTSPIGIFATG